MTAYYSAFGKRLMLPVHVYQKGVLIGPSTWDFELWVDNMEEWRTIKEHIDDSKKVRVVTRDDWEQAMARKSL